MGGAGRAGGYRECSCQWGGDIGDDMGGCERSVREGRERLVRVLISIQKGKMENGR
jgi:hypothetical protein